MRSLGLTWSAGIPAKLKATSSPTLAEGIRPTLSRSIAPTVAGMALPLARIKTASPGRIYYAYEHDSIDWRLDVEHVLHREREQLVGHAETPPRVSHVRNAQAY